MNRGKKWYKSAKYHTPFEPFELGDGSIVENVKDPDERHPDALKVTRIWPDGHVTTVRLVPGSAVSDALYLEVSGDRAPPPTPEQQRRMEESAKQLANGSYRVPFAVTSAIPGKRPGETYDPATDKYFETRAKFNEYYKQNKLEQVSPQDSMFKFNADEQVAASTNVQGYDVNKGPPVPKGFEGARFATVGMGGD